MIFCFCILYTGFGILYVYAYFVVFLSKKEHSIRINNDYVNDKHIFLVVFTILFLVINYSFSNTHIPFILYFKRTYILYNFNIHNDWNTRKYINN